MNYLALLRGINVGGKNMVKMPDLRICLERLSLNNVSTYIQSGNALFNSAMRNPARLSLAIEEAVAREFGCTALVVVVSEGQLESVLKQAPSGFGLHAALYRYDVAFLKPPLCAPQVLPTVILKDGVDEAFGGAGVLYFRRRKDRSTQSHLPRLIDNPAYKSMTIRNWNTTATLSTLIRAG